MPGAIRSEEAIINGLESHALKLGAAIAKNAAKSWLQRRKTQFERDASLAELAQAELKGPLQTRKLENLVDRIGQQVAEQLAPVMEERFGGLPDNEAEAAILAVVDALVDVDLSDKALLSADADPEVLAMRVRAQFPRRTALLSEQGTALHELALDQACRHLVQVIRHLPSFQSAALAEVLSRLTGQSDQLDQLLSRVPTTSLYAPQGANRDDEFRVEYLRRLAATLDRLDLLGLPGDDQPTLALTVAYLSLSVSGGSGRGDRRRRLHPESWFDPQARHGSWRAEGLSVEAAIGEEARVLLRGDAGSGKTTLLNWLAVRAARNELTGALSEWNGRVPFVVRLRTFAEGDLPTPEQFVRHATPVIAELAPEGWAFRMLHTGRAMLLVDGVDEVPAARRRAVKAWLRDLLMHFPDTQVVVTSRTAAADSKWLTEEKFTAVTLEPMSSSNILSFVERWHHAAEMSGADIGDAEPRLRAQLERAHLRQLAGSPLLCAMLCALNLSHRSELPRNRMDLYAKALAMLLHLRDAERGIEALTGESEKRVLLRDLAWRLTLANKVELPRSEALSHITRKLPGIPNATELGPTMVFDHLLERSGVLQEPVPGRIDFVHRTFLEYLAADEAVQQHHIDTVIGHAHWDTWWETVVMACGHATTTQANQLLTGILNRAEEEPGNARRLRLLAAACLETARDLDPTVRQRIDHMVRQKLIPPRSLRETASLTSVGPHLLRYLPGTLDGLSEAKAAATTRIAALTGTKDALRLLASYAQDSRGEVQDELASAWRYFDPERFALEVLANSPLKQGKWSISSLKYVPHLRHLTALTRLDVWLHTEVAEKLEIFAELPLESIYLTLDNSTPYDLRMLGDQPQLRNIHLEGLAATEDLSALAEFPTLRQVILQEYRDDTLSRLTEMDGVKSLTLFHHHDGKVEQALRAFPSINYLNLINHAPPDFRQITRLTSLNNLVLQSMNLDTIAPLAQITGLQYITINGVHFDGDLRPLAALDLRSITLSKSSTYTGLESLKCEILWWS